MTLVTDTPTVKERKEKSFYESREGSRSAGDRSRQSTFNREYFRSFWETIVSQDERDKFLRAPFFRDSKIDGQTLSFPSSLQKNFSIRVLLIVVFSVIFNNCKLFLYEGNYIKSLY